ncbi:MAG TPA: hypothetical protein VHE35_22615, partial [Kofleriaceae bacterium]|nr:hypothetical protein [Kofleriaceae bacterium]
MAAATALLAGGCLPSPEHHCDESAAMACGASGACVDGYCAFADSACPSGLRYGDGAGARSGACAGGSGPVDAAVDAPADHGFGLGLDGPALVTAPIERSFNTCAPVVAGPAGRVVDYDRGAMVVATLPGVGDFEPGRLVIVWQTSSAANGAITVGDQAPSTTALVGRWQVSRVVAAERGRLTLADDLAFAPAAGAQVCRVPELTTVDIRSAMVDGVLQPIDVRPAPWNGAAGGLVAFYASDTVTISGAGTSISASSHGFRGGAGTTTAGATADCQELSGPTANGGGAHRGEGPFSDYYAAGDGAPEAFGRGNAASGGGGGDCLDAGGGGGAGGVAGGEGGYQATAAHTGSGLGGAPIVADPRTQLLMGGGGGGGEGNDGQAGAGGPG